MPKQFEPDTLTSVQGNEFEEDDALEEGEVEGALGAEPETISDEEDDGVTSPQDVHNRVGAQPVVSDWLDYLRSIIFLWWHGCDASDVDA